MSPSSYVLTMLPSNHTDNDDYTNQMLMKWLKVVLVFFHLDQKLLKYQLILTNMIGLPILFLRQVWPNSLWKRKFFQHHVQHQKLGWLKVSQCRDLTLLKQTSLCLNVMTWFIQMYIRNS